MDVPGFLSLLHQLFPGFPVVLIVVVAVVALAIILIVQGRKREGQRIDGSFSLSAGPAAPSQSSDEPLSPSPGPSSHNPPIAPIVEVRPTISPVFHNNNYYNVPPDLTLQASAASTGTSPIKPLAPAVPTESVDSGSAAVVPPVDMTPGRQTGDLQSVRCTQDELPAQHKPAESPDVEMYQFTSPVVVDAPHLEPEGATIADTPPGADSDMGTQADLHQSIPNSQIELIDDVVVDAPSAEPLRATSSGRLTAQRSDAQTALRMMSSITQKTYAYVRAIRRDAVAQKPFANELRSVRLLDDYIRFVRPRLLRLNRSLNRLGISWEEFKADPRWIVFAFLDPFSIVLVERSPIAMRQAMIDAAQKVADAIRELGYVVVSERKWGSNGALFYSLDDRGGLIMDIDEADWPESDIDEADVDLDEDGEDL